jgi:hypothetical protein
MEKRNTSVCARIIPFSAIHKRHEKSDTCRVEDSYLNIKGKRLDPLKTEEVKLVLKPTVQGTFSLKPTVLYLDENGARACQTYAIPCQAF